MVDHAPFVATRVLAGRLAAGDCDQLVILEKEPVDGIRDGRFFQRSPTAGVYGGIDGVLSHAPPLGAPGRLRWIRETITIDPDGRPRYAADGQAIVTPEALDWARRKRVSAGARPGEVLQVPPMHAPRALSRTTLVIQESVAQHLQDTRPEDLVREGFTMAPGNSNTVASLAQYAAEWDVQHPEAPWASNPPVWRIRVQRHPVCISAILQAEQVAAVEARKPAPERKQSPVAPHQPKLF